MSNEQQTNQIPHRFNEQSFRRYEPFIKRVMEDWPSVLTFDVRPIATCTFACRLRDAMRSLVQFRWPTSIDLEKFIKLQPEVCVSERINGQVLVGPIYLLRTRKPISGAEQATAEFSAKSNSGIEFNSQSANKILSVDRPSQQVLDSLACLLENRLLTKVILTGVSLEVVEELEHRFDVAHASDTNEGNSFFVLF